MPVTAIVIENGQWRVGVLPDTGGSLAFGQVRLPGREHGREPGRDRRREPGREPGWFDLLRPTRAAGRRTPPQCASYVLVPFSNRVRDGVLRFGERSWQLRRNSPDGTAIHGTANEFAWDVAEKSADAATLTFSSARVVGANFPWSFDAAVTYALDGPRLTVRTELTSTDAEPFPAGFGHHPFFRRGIVDPTVSEVLVQLPFERAYPLRRALPTGPAGSLPAAADYRELRPLAERPFVDACLTGRRGVEPVRMRWPASGVDLTLHADEVFSHLVLYVPRGRGFFAVEPVTNANDGFTLLADGVPGHGVFVLGPGESRRGEFHLDLDVDLDLEA